MTFSTSLLTIDGIANGFFTTSHSASLGTWRCCKCPSCLFLNSALISTFEVFEESVRCISDVRCLLVIAISAAESHSVETLNIMKLASKARSIVNKPVVTEVRYVTCYLLPACCRMSTVASFVSSTDKVKDCTSRSLSSVICTKSAEI